MSTVEVTSIECSTAFRHTADIRIRADSGKVVCLDFELNDDEELQLTMLLTSIRARAEAQAPQLLMIAGMVGQ